DEQPQKSFGTQLFRLSPFLSFERLKVKLSVDMVRGLAFGDTDRVASGYRMLDIFDDRGGLGFSGLRLREAYFSYKTSFGLFKVGQQVSKWGMGILASSGRDRRDRFGEAWYGDYVARVLFATKPLGFMSAPGVIGENLYLALAADLVVEDENAILKDGDKAFQAIASLFYRHDQNFIGTYVVYRDQEDRDGDRLSVTAMDLYIKLCTRLQKGRPLDTVLGIEAEGAYLLGTTDKLEAVYAPDGLAIGSFGGVLRAWAFFKSIGLESSLEAGYASGDSDMYDSKGRVFTFDPDYNVGLILYDEVQKAVAARAIEDASDPSRLSTAPKGLDLSATSGSVTNTIYLFPGIELRPGRLDTFDLAYLAAWSAAPFISLYETFRTGAPANPYGAPAGDHFLGQEVDMSYMHVFELWEKTTATIRVQAGMFWPGGAFEDVQGKKPKVVSKMMASLYLDWR
ncbi:MAG: hypothetical protein GXP49_18015, partial [Deltaproteobacteria bacterium]|nr:hypothetical protein [Deltaproteobacteria bacterium]